MLFYFTPSCIRVRKIVKAIWSYCVPHGVSMSDRGSYKFFFVVFLIIRNTLFVTRLYIILQKVIKYISPNQPSEIMVFIEVFTGLPGKLGIDREFNFVKNGLIKHGKDLNLSWKSTNVMISWINFCFCKRGIIRFV